MSRAAGHFATLARLQRLAELERRREVEVACAETDRHERTTRDLADRLACAEHDHAAAHMAEALCLLRLTIAAAIVTASEGACDRARTTLAAARTAEGAAAAAWLQSRFRTDHFADRDRAERRRDGARRADRADADARLSRIGREA